MLYTTSVVCNRCNNVTTDVVTTDVVTTDVVTDCCNVVTDVVTL